ncbi:hypothetical protein K2173_004983 [Erythroxylum novogranatense]|uniref:PLAC8 motif-containing protein n=1 Tax=Erythroxylum novogranatense TaxID=1862640 RepID=A0AAV8TB48_9ROSI|nr:hypothetical protein K2173_004983 [Erythroxylum novogranatense]
MDANANGDQKVDIGKSTGVENNSQIPLEISTSRTLLSNGVPYQKFWKSLTALPNIMKFIKLDYASTRLEELARGRDEISPSVVSSDHGFRDRISDVLCLKMDWTLLVKMSKEWLRNPMNMALFMWIMCVTVSGGILFLVITGMLNKVLPNKSQRNAWLEANNQILNALFTLMCLYQHPKRFYHFILLCRWKAGEISKLRMIYCKNGTYKTHEWAHMMVVVVLLHINCFAQYALCGLNLGYKRSQRPVVGVGICMSIAIAAAAVAGVYSIVSPLGKDYDSEVDEEAPTQTIAGEIKRPEQNDQNIVEARPQWSGGILDFCDDISLAYLSLFCSFCVFGWNMERLGFGNMYVHTATFLLFCMAPFWIFNLAAINIDNEIAREAFGLTGIILCIFGLLYGGFWRIQMRKRFNLPAYNFCFGQPSASDCTLWLCCFWCSLAQEVRTGNSYYIVKENFCRKQMDHRCKVACSLSPTTDSMGPANPGWQPYEVKNNSCTGCNGEIMMAPTPSLIEKETI